MTVCVIIIMSIFFCPNLAYANREVYLSIDLSIYISRAFLVITTRGRHLPTNSSNNSLNVAEILDLPSFCHNFGDTICVIVFFFQINNAYLSFYFSEYVILVVSIIFCYYRNMPKKRILPTDTGLTEAVNKLKRLISYRYVEIVSPQSFVLSQTMFKFIYSFIIAWICATVTTTIP